MHSFSLPHPVQCQEMRKCLITLFDQQTRYFRSTWKSIDTTLSSKSLSNISQNDTPPQTRIMLILLKLHLFNFISRSYQIPDGLRPQCLPPIIIKAWLESSRQTLDPIHFRKHQGFWNASWNSGRFGWKRCHCGSKLGYQKQPKKRLIGSLLNGSILGAHQPLLPLFQAGKMLKSPNSTSQDSSIAPPRCAQMWSNLLAISLPPADRQNVLLICQSLCHSTA